MTVLNECFNLEKLTFPSSLQNVNGINFLGGCGKLREVKIMGTKVFIEFYNLYGYTSDLTLYVDSSLVDVYKANIDSNNRLYKVLPLQQ